MLHSFFPVEWGHTSAPLQLPRIHQAFHFFGCNPKQRPPRDGLQSGIGASFVVLCRWQSSRSTFHYACSRWTANFFNPLYILCRKHRWDDHLQVGEESRPNCHVSFSMVQQTKGSGVAPRRRFGPQFSFFFPFYLSKCWESITTDLDQAPDSMNNIIWGVMRGITISLTMLPITLANIRCLEDQSQAGDTGRGDLIEKTAVGGMWMERTLGVA